MVGAVAKARIASVCFFNTTYSCFMASMVESPSCNNAALGYGFCKACTSCFDASIALSADDVKAMVK